MILLLYYFPSQIIYKAFSYFHIFLNHIFLHGVFFFAIHSNTYLSIEVTNIKVYVDSVWGILLRYLLNYSTFSCSMPGAILFFVFFNLHCQVPFLVHSEHFKNSCQRRYLYGGLLGWKPDLKFFFIDAFWYYITVISIISLPCLEHPLVIKIKKGKRKKQLKKTDQHVYPLRHICGILQLWFSTSMKREECKWFFFVLFSLHFL